MNWFESNHEKMTRLKKEEETKRINLKNQEDKKIKEDQRKLKRELRSAKESKARRDLEALKESKEKFNHVLKEMKEQNKTKEELKCTEQTKTKFADVMKEIEEKQKFKEESKAWKEAKLKFTKVLKDIKENFNTKQEKIEDLEEFKVTLKHIVKDIKENFETYALNDIKENLETKEDSKVLKKSKILFTTVESNQKEFVENHIEEWENKEDSIEEESNKKLNTPIDLISTSSKTLNKNKKFKNIQTKNDLLQPKSNNERASKTNQPTKNMFTIKTPATRKLGTLQTIKEEEENETNENKKKSK